MDLRVKQYLDLEYPMLTEVERSSDGSDLFAAWVADIPGCIAQGSSLVEAVERLRSLFPAYLEQLLKRDVPIPPPSPKPSVKIGEFGLYDPQTGSMFGLGPTPSPAKVRPDRPADSESQSFAAVAA